MLAARTYYDVSRIRSLDQWWHWLILALVVISLVTFVISLYRRDGHELPRSLRWLLLLLRITAFAGLLIFFLKIEKRTEQKLVKNSRAILLVDTSQSMGLSDPSPAGATRGTRLETVKGLLGESTIVGLRKAHDVAIYTFDQQERPTELALLARTTSASNDDEPVDADSRALAAINEVRTFYTVGAVLLAIALLAILAHLLFGQRVRTGEGESWALLLGVIFLIVASVCFSVSHLRQPQVGWRQIFRGESFDADAPDEDKEPDEAAPQLVDDKAWRNQLTPQGLETRLGDAIQFHIDKERGGPIAGITVFTDGNGNAGSEYSDALLAAQEAEIPVNFVGIGTSDRPSNVRLVDIEAPARVYPGDEFRVKAFVQAYGLRGKSAKIELGSAADINNADSKPTTTTFEDERVITLAADGEITAIEFTVLPEELGRRLYTLKVSSSGSDLDPDDNQQTARVQIVDRKNRVLLLAGGPTREYRFVRNLFYRDKNTTLDVLLQSAPNGAAQEANTILEEFPATAEELFEYDCIMAFDPDWEQLDSMQITLLDRWVAEKSGGLILVAGPVFMPEWTTLRRETPSTETLKALYPVTFFSRTVARLARGEIAEKPKPINFTDNGRQSRFLWLDDTAVRSESNWAGFEGVYQSFPVRSVKPGATILANLDKSSSSSSDQEPVLIAEQFYGSGRVLYIGSGELWRLRSTSVAQFEQLYTKIIRHVSQGRLLRDSARGVLMLAKDRCLLGETVVVRASLTDQQFRPLTNEKVMGDLVQPDGVRRPLELRAVKDATRAGSYTAQFTAVREGDYRVELPVPNSDDLELLVRELKVRVPQLEVENPQRNDAVMNEIATATGGKYYTDLNQVADAANPEGLVASIIPQDQETYLPGTPDQAFQQRLMGWLMALICGVLCLEWLFRRLSKLA